VEACPAAAIEFGDLDDETSAVSKAAGNPETFRLLSALGTGTKVYYRSRRPWVRQLAEKDPAKSRKEALHG
jgi:Fe-S-cluster-containing dehydrogenase component